MMSIDQYAYINRLRAMHPMEKFMLSMGMLFISLFNQSWLLHVGVIALMAYLVIGVAKIPWKAYGAYLLFPSFFLLIGMIGIVFTITKDGSMLLFKYQWQGWALGISTHGLKEARVIFFRSYASVTCLYFLVLTTPMIDLIWIMKKLRMPEIITELMALMYRFIFIFMETASMIYVSQECRLGYSSKRRSYDSLGKLLSNLFIKAYYRAKELFIGLTARGYTGQMNVLEEEHQICVKNIIYILSLETILILYIFLC